MKEEIHMNIQTWESFYEEFASKLLEFKDNREPLIEAIKNVYTNIDLKLPKLEKDITREKNYRQISLVNFDMVI